MARQTRRSFPDRDNALYFQAFALLLAVVAVVLSLVVASGASLLVTLVAVGVVSYVAGSSLIFRRLLGTRYYDFRLALTGQPLAGKTVLANVLYDQLMNGNNPDFEFTADSKSAIATYQAIRGIERDEWPARTSGDSVLLHDGELRHRRAIVDVEIGDSAGQHWLAVAQEKGPEVDYLQWMLSAHALVHLIPSDRIIESGFASTVRSDVADLKLAAQLMRNVRGSRYRPVPILIVISKVDLLLNAIAREAGKAIFHSPTRDHWLEGLADDLLRVYSEPELAGLTTTVLLEAVTNVRVTEVLAGFARELAVDFGAVSFMYSSAEVVRSLYRVGAQRRPDIAGWIVKGAAAQAQAKR